MPCIFLTLNYDTDCVYNYECEPSPSKSNILIIFGFSDIQLLLSFTDQAFKMLEHVLSINITINYIRLIPTTNKNTLSVISYRRPHIAKHGNVIYHHSLHSCPLFFIYPIKCLIWKF